MLYSTVTVSLYSDTVKSVVNSSFVRIYDRLRLLYHNIKNLCNTNELFNFNFKLNIARLSKFSQLNHAGSQRPHMHFRFETRKKTTSNRWSIQSGSKIAAVKSLGNPHLIGELSQSSQLEARHGSVRGYTSYPILPASCWFVGFFLYFSHFSIKHYCWLLVTINHHTTMRIFSTFLIFALIAFPAVLIDSKGK